MDLLYSKYASPMDLMSLYIKQGRFGAFVSGVVEAENKRIQDDIEKHNDLKLWIAYVHSFSNCSFEEWKSRALSDKGNTNQSNNGGDLDLDEKGMETIINNLFKG